MFEILFGLVAFSIGVHLLYKNVMNWKYSKKSRNWMRVEGIIESSHKNELDGETVTYLPEVTYRYVVKGVQYIGNEIAFGQKHVEESSKDADEMISHYQQGKKVDVYIDPNNPRQSVLQKGETSYSVVLFLVV